MAPFMTEDEAIAEASRRHPHKKFSVQTGTFKGKTYYEVGFYADSIGVHKFEPPLWIVYYVGESLEKAILHAAA